MDCQAVAASQPELLALSLKWCRKCSQVRHLGEFSKGQGAGGKHTYCKSCERTSKREWCASNRASARARCISWRLANLSQERQRSVEKARRDRATPEGRIRSRVGRRMLEVLRGKAPKGGRTFEILGYTPAELKAHLERQFVKGMGWHNMGEWHIDHILPVSSFRFESTDDPEFKRAWSLPNLRPLWAAENLKKNAKRLTLL